MECIALGFLREVTLDLSPAGTLENVPMELLQENLVPVEQEAFKQERNPAPAQ